MKLKVQKFNPWLVPLVILLFGIGFTWGYRTFPLAFAASTEAEYRENVSEYFVTIYDDGNKLIVKSSAATVKDLLDRLKITYSDADIIEPSLDAEINSDNFFINIFRARPVILRDGNHTKYFLTAAKDPRMMFEAADITVFDGDEITPTKNIPFLAEVGVSEAYEITRNGGRQVTVTEEIPFAEETVKDYKIPVGSSEVRQLGAVGTKTLVFEINYVDGHEVSRTLISEEITKAPVARITAQGARASLRPEWDTCAGYAREAGVSEADLPTALTLIYRESGCRIDAENASSGAYGIPQALPKSKLASAGDDWETNPVTQIRWMINYVNGRYGGWTGALEHSDSHGWY